MYQRTSSKIDYKHENREQGQKVIEWNTPIHLVLNTNGQYVLPFSRRVIDINLPWLIKEQSPPAMINHGNYFCTDVNIASQGEMIKKNDLFIIDRRIHGRDDDEDNFFDEDYDDDDSIDEGERLLDEHVVNYTKFLWALHGKSIPDDFINPFEIYD